MTKTFTKKDRYQMVTDMVTFTKKDRYQMVTDMVIDANGKTWIELDNALANKRGK
jgi:hypothetical protein